MVYTANEANYLPIRDIVQGVSGRRYCGRVSLGQLMVSVIKNLPAASASPLTHLHLPFNNWRNRRYSRLYEHLSYFTSAGIKMHLVFKFKAAATDHVLRHLTPFVVNIL